MMAEFETDPQTRRTLSSGFSRTNPLADLGLAQ